MSSDIQPQSDGGDRPVERREDQTQHHVDVDGAGDGLDVDGRMTQDPVEDHERGHQQQHEEHQVDEG